MLTVRLIMSVIFINAHYACNYKYMKYFCEIRYNEIFNQLNKHKMNQN